MKKISENNEGITLVALVITIVIILILASVATYSGVNTIKSSEFTRFSAELKIMQTQVNELYEKWKNNEKIKEILSLGEEIQTSSQVQQQANKIFTEENSGITDQTGYRYFSRQTIKDLKIEGVKQDFFINVQTRNIISYNGMEYKEKKYYTPEQIGVYNIDYRENASKPTFNINIDMLAQNEYKVTINNIKYDGYINKWKVKYQKENDNYWNTSEELNFTIKEAGKYNIYLQNGEIQSDHITTQIGYIEEGLALHYDGEINTRRGNNLQTTIWEDLSINNNDAQIKNEHTYNKKSINLNNSTSGITGNYGEKLRLTDFTLEIVLESYDLNSNGATLYDFYTGDNAGHVAKIYNDSLVITFGNTVCTHKYNFLNSNYPLAITIRCNKTENNFKININNDMVYNYNGTIDMIQSTDSLFGILNNSECNEQPYYGKLNNFKIYNRVLTNDEVQQNYQINKNRFNIQ